MYTTKQHIEKAKYNEKFFENVKDEYQDWAITGLFYSALHFVDAFLVGKGLSAEDHKTRAWHVEHLKELKPLYGDYRAMYDYSVNARYKMQKLTVESLNDIHKTFFTPIKKEISKHIAAAAKKA